MTNQEKQLEQLAEIRNLMERSSRFLSLSGLSGVFAGIWALMGAVVAYYIIAPDSVVLDEAVFMGLVGNKKMLYLFADMAAVLVFAVSTGIYFTTRKARKEGIKTWDHVALRSVVNLAIPLIVGGGFCLVLIAYDLFFLVAPSTLIFYGLALVNTSKYTFKDVRYLGFIEVALGFLGCVFTGHGFILWVVGFGFMHILYGIIMYVRYER